MKMGQKKKRKRKNLNIIEHSIWKKKKERTNFFFFEKKRKENWTFLNCDCNIVLTCFKVKSFWVCLSLKAALEHFFSCSYYEIWRKQLTEDFTLGLIIIAIILILNVFLEFGFSWNMKYFFCGGVCFDELVADARLGQTVIQVVLQIVVG